MACFLDSVIEFFYPENSHKFSAFCADELPYTINQLVEIKILTLTGYKNYPKFGDVGFSKDQG